MLKRSVFRILYAVAQLVIGCLVWALSVEAINRLAYFLPGSLLRDLLEKYGAQIGDDVTMTPPVTFHNLADRTDKPFQNLSIGAHCYFGRALFLDLKDRIIIGDYVTVAMDVMLITHTDVAESPLKESLLPPSNGPIRIERGAYLGARTTILQGVTIGEESVVAAGALIIRDVPPHTVYGGVPAVELKNFAK